MTKYILLGLVLFPCLVMAQLVGQESYEMILGVNTIDLDGDNVSVLYGEPFSSEGVWVPDLDSAGTYVVDVTATDGEESTVEQIEVIIENTNQAPEPLNEQLYVLEGATVHMDMFWYDPDDDVLFHTNSGPFKDFVWEVGYDEAGVYEFEFETNDGEFEVEHTFVINVEDINRAPNITSVWTTSPVEIKENETVNFFVTVDDDNEYSVEWVLDNVSLSIETQSLYTFNFSSAGKHNLTVIVMDEEYTVSESWEIFVEDVNRAPNFDNIYDTINEDEPYTVMLPLVDEDGDNLTYIYPEPFFSDGTYTFNFNESGVYEYEIEVSDSEFTELISLHLTVINVNRAPVLTVDDTSLAEGETLNWSYSFEDFDNDNVTIEINGLPTYAEVNNDTISWYADYDAIQRNSNRLTNFFNAIGLESLFTTKRDYDITFIACDYDYCIEEDRVLTVFNTNRAPEIEQLENQTILENEVFELYVGASDEDGDVLEYDFGWPLDSNGVWTPSYDDAGEYVVPVTVKDRNEMVTDYVTLTVEHVNRAPQINTDSLVRVNEGNSIEFTLDIFDPDDDVMTVNASWLPVNSSLNSTTFFWDVPHTLIYENDPTLVSKIAELTGVSNRYLNPYKDVSSIDFTVSDGNLTDTITVEFVIADRNIAPVLTAVEESFRAVGVYEPLTFSVGVTDADNDDIEYEWSFSGLDTQVITDTSNITHQFVYEGQKQVSVKVSDGIASESYTWDIDVTGVATSTSTDLTYRIVELSDWK